MSEEAGAQFCSKCGSKVEPNNVVADVDAIFSDDEDAYADPFAEDEIHIIPEFDEE